MDIGKETRRYKVKEPARLPFEPPLEKPQQAPVPEREPAHVKQDR